MLKIDVNKDYDEARWFTMQTGDEPSEDDPQFQIRTYPQSKEKFAGREGGEFILTGDALFTKFKYCLVNWKNVTDANGNLIEITDQAKKVIYDNSLGGIPAFVNEKIAELIEEREGDLKN